MNHKKIAILYLSVVVLSVIFYAVMEPSMAHAFNAGPDSANITAVVSKEIDISSPADVNAFSASIPGMTGNPGSPATASLTWTVKTNDASGFTMTLAAQAANALQIDGSHYFTDAQHTAPAAYATMAPTTGNTVFAFTVVPHTAADAVLAFQDASGTCGSAGTVGNCWQGFNDSTPINVINRSTMTSNAGEAEVVNFRAEANLPNPFLKSGNYTATITATVAAP